MSYGNAISNFEAQFKSWGKIDKGTLKLDPELGNLSIRELLDKANVAFDVLLGKTQFYDAVTGTWRESASFSTYRADTSEELGVGFAEGYTPRSYPVVFEKIYGDIIENGGIPTRVLSFPAQKTDTPGGRIAIQVIHPQVFFVADRPHGLFSNIFASHDGTQGILHNTCDVCIVCCNTYARALASGENRAYARHTKNLDEKLIDIGRTFYNVRQNAPVYYQFLDKTSINRATPADVKSFIASVLQITGDEKTAAKDNQAVELNSAILTSLAERNTKELTFYDLLQGATRYTSYNVGKRSPDEQFAYVTSGPGAKLNDRAFAFVEERLG